MSQFTAVDPLQLQENPFQLIGKDWTLITARKGDKVNTMTASWGGLGVLWNKNVAFIFIRPQRYTFDLVNDGETFSLNFLQESFRPMLGYCGKASGRDEDKIAHCGFHISTSENTPYIEEGRLAVICRKLYAQDLDPAAFFDASILPQCYSDQDYHRMFIGEIVKVLVKE